MSVTLGVHRCRFVDYAPSAITAIAFTPLSLPSPTPSHASPLPTATFGALFVGHSNGNIDICEWTGQGNSAQSSQAWTVKKTLPGSYPSKIDSLALVIRDPKNHQPEDVPGINDLRLFSSGGGSDLVEWDIARGTIRRTLASQAGTIWSIAVNPSHTRIALGCEDGTVRLISIQNDSLIHSQKLDRAKCRILSIAWGPPILPTPRTEDDMVNEEDMAPEWKDSWLVAGCSDSSLRKWDVLSGRVLDRMSVDKLRGERTLVWAIGVLGDGTIISGDSLGLVKFWDSKTCTQLQSFKGHRADVLSLTVGPEGTTVYTSGVDQKVTQFSLVKTAIGQGRLATRWVQSASRRLHSHDVRTLAIWPPYTCLPQSHKRSSSIHFAPILASGGLDMSVLLTPAAVPSSTVVKISNPLLTSQDCTFEESHHRRIAYPCGPYNSPAVHIARDARIVFCTRDAGLSAWRLPPGTSSDSADEAPEPQGTHEHLLEMDFQVQSNLLSSAVSHDGAWLAISDIDETKLFALTLTDGQLHPHKIRTFTSSLHQALGDRPTGASQLVFSPDSNRLVLALARSSQIVVVDLTTTEVPVVLRVFSHSAGGERKITGRMVDTDVQMTDSEDVVGGSPGSQILRLAVSSDGQWLAASDESGQTMIFNLDALQHHCALPTFSKHVQTMSFDTLSPNMLLLAFPDNTIQIFDVESRQFPSWAKTICNNLPPALTEANDSILGIELSPGLDAADAHYVLVWGSTWLAKLNLDGPNAALWSGKKRRRHSAPVVVDDPDEEEGKNFKMVRGYRPILAVAYLGPSEIVVVERPLVDVLATLTPPYFSEKYGKT